MLTAATGGSTMTLWQVGLVFGLLPLAIALSLGGVVYLTASRRPPGSGPALGRPAGAVPHDDEAAAPIGQPPQDGHGGADGEDANAPAAESPEPPNEGAPHP